jgi:23S rRNA pseudouridine1911/1915/1917 synthase
MVKISSGDCLAILRRFELAGNDNVPRHIKQLTYSHPRDTNTMASFQFNKQQFYILFDEAAEDDTDYVMSQIRTIKQDMKGSILENPQDHSTTYALPFKSKEVYLYAVMSDKIRLDLLLAQRYPDYSRSTWQKYVKAGYVTVNTTIIDSPKTDVLETDVISISLPDKVDYSTNELPIIYIDDNVIVINKPIGVLTHTKGAMNEEFTVADFFRRYTTVGLETNRPGIVHRLDRDTSGVMIGARNEKTAHLLQKQFSDRKTKKTYIAIVDGHLKNATAKIDLPISRNPSAPSTFRVDPKGRAAVTRYSVLAENEKSSLIRLEPVTGRTHQLRVHMLYLGSAIKGDRIYGKVSDRLYLHAQKLEITIPEGHRRVFEAALPDAFHTLFPGQI